MAWAPDYCTLMEMRHFKHIDDDVDDVELGIAVTATSRAIDLDCNRQFGVVASVEERFYTAEWDRRRCRWVVAIDDLMTITGLDPQIQDSDGVDLGAIDSYVLEPRNAAVKGRPWEALVVKPDSTRTPTGAEFECAFTGLWGWTAVPVPIKGATLLQGSRFDIRRDSPYGIAGSPSEGSELRLLAKVDPDVAVMLRGYRRWWGAA